MSEFIEADIAQCCCLSPEHAIHFKWVRTTYFNVREDAELYVEVFLKHRPWYKRLWYGVRYILGYQSRFGAFDEAIMLVPEVKQLRDICDRFLDCQENQEC